jgi:hypothetical protein
MPRQLSASIEKVFLSLDADGNGFLDRNELKAGFASMVLMPPALIVIALSLRLRLSSCLVVCALLHGI